VTTTLLLSDLHLGGRYGADLLRLPGVRAPLMERLGRGVDRVVLLGDALELRHGPIHEPLERARPFFEELGEALGGGEVVMVTGNHDHELVAPWLHDRGLNGRSGALRLDELVPPRSSPLASRIARWIAPAELSLRHPGTFVRPDVYALHGHFVDRHLTVPTFERLGVSVMDRLVGRPPERSQPDDYNAAVAPVYAFLHALAQWAPPAGGSPGHGASVRTWQQLAGEGRSPVRRLAYRTAFRAGVRGLNLLGLGPFESRISGDELRRSALRAIGEVLGRLGIEGGHAVFGHTHRAGPWPGDDPREWITPSGTRLHNTGSWVYQPHFLSREPHQSPYWPGTAVRVEETGPPALERLLGDRTLADLAG
jgi:hypothetical protein